MNYRSLFYAAGFPFLFGAIVHAAPVVEKIVSFGNPGIKEVALGICETSGNGFALCGTDGNTSAFVRKVNLQDSTVWSGSFSHSSTQVLNAISRRYNGNLFFSGFASTGLFGNDDHLLGKYDSVGNTAMVSNLGSQFGDRSYSHVITSDSGFVLAGFTTTSSSDTDVVLYKYNKNDSLISSKTFPSTGWQVCYSIAATANNGYILAGGYRGPAAPNNGTDAFLLKLDSLGNITWFKTFGGTGEDIAYDVISTKDGGYVITGGTTSNTGVNGEDAFIAKFNSSGTNVWCTVNGDVQSDAAYSVVELVNSELVLAANVPSATDSSVQLVSVSKYGSVKWVKKFKGYINQPGNYLSTDGGKVRFCYTAVDNGDTNATVATVKFCHYVKAGESIQAAVDAANDGDTVWVGPGVYKENGTRRMNPNNPHSDSMIATLHIERPVSVISIDGPEKTIIDGQHRWRCVQMNYCGFASPIALLQGFTIRNGASNGDEGGGSAVLIGDFQSSLERKHNYIRNCYLVNNTFNSRKGWGVVLIKDGGSIENCLIAHNTLIQGGDVVQYGGYVIYIQGGGYARNCTIVKNVAENGRISGICIYSSRDSANCIIRDNFGIVEADTLIETDPYDPGFVGPDSLIAGYSPSFSSYTASQFGNYRLTANSPYKNAGNNVYGPVTPVDLDGNPRIKGTAIDKGVYEYQE